MFESFDKSTFQASDPTPSASPVQGTLHDALHDTVRENALECSEAKGYTIEQISSICNIARRTAFKYASEVLQTWYWLPEYQFRVNGSYSEFAVAELKRRKALGNLDNYRSVVHGDNAEAIAAWKASQLPQQQPTEPAVEPEVVDEIGSLARIQQDRYVVPTDGSDRLRQALERREHQRSSLSNTRERVKLALLGLATQAQEDAEATDLEKETRREQIYEEAYAEGLEELQIKNAAKRDAVADWEAFKRQAMGKGQAPNSSASA